MADVICPTCGVKNDSVQNSCANCGKPLKPQAAPPTPQRQETARKEGESAGSIYLFSATVSLLGLLAVIGVVIFTVMARGKAVGSAFLGGELSAMQVTQIYSEAAFWLLAIIAIVLAVYAFDHAR